MGTSTMSESGTGTSLEFGADNLLVNAKLYKDNKAIVDACSRYDSIDDAIVGLRETWVAFEAQVESGAGYTPDTKLGFGSDNAAVIAESILGRRNTVGATRKALRDMGK